MKNTEFFYYAFPRSLVLVSVASSETKVIAKGDICTVAWHTPLSHKPALYGVAIHKTRLTHSLIKKTKDFVINFLDIKYFEKIHLCGRKSGRDIDKFKIFSAEKSCKVKSPTISESYASFECGLKKSITLGDHTLFIGKIVKVRVKKNVFKNRIINCKPTFFLGKNFLGNEFYCSIGNKYMVKRAKEV